MTLDERYHWLSRGQRRKIILLRFRQPSTANQLSRQLDMSRDACSYGLSELCTYLLASCLNSTARCSRLYWLTELGREYQQLLRQASDLESVEHDFPVVDWNLYGWVCYRHRAAILKALREPMQPAQIKRVARSQNPELRMSANNCRDVIRLFRARDIVRPVQVRRKAHALYELTDLGQDLRRLLLRAEEGA